MDAAQLRRPALWKRFAQYALVALCTIYVVQFFRANTDALKLAAAVRPSAVVWLIVLNLVSLLLQSCRQRKLRPRRLSRMLTRRTRQRLGLRR